MKVRAGMGYDAGKTRRETPREPTGFTLTRFVAISSVFPMKAVSIEAIFTAIALICAVPTGVRAAVIIPQEGRFSWNYNLLGSAGGSTVQDQFAIQFGDDRLSAGESLRVEVFPSGQSIPSWVRTINGFGAGLNGSLYFGELDAYFPNRSGTISFEILAGTVNLERITIILNTPLDRTTASISPDVTLVPEPGTTLLICVCGLMAAFRRNIREIH